MKTNTETKRNLAVYVRIDSTTSGFEYGEKHSRIEAFPCFQGTNVDEPDHSSVEYEYDGLKDLCFYAFLSSKVEAHETTAYHGSTTLAAKDIYRAELRDIEAIAKRMKSITAKLDKLSAIAGPSASFGAAVVRFATAIGAKRIYVMSNEKRLARTGCKWAGYDTSNSAFAVDDKVREWNETYAPAHKQAETVSA